MKKQAKRLMDDILDDISSDKEDTGSDRDGDIGTVSNTS